MKYDTRYMQHVRSMVSRVTFHVKIGCREATAVFFHIHFAQTQTHTDRERHVQCARLRYTGAADSLKPIQRAQYLSENEENETICVYRQHQLVVLSGNMHWLRRAVDSVVI